MNISKIKQYLSESCPWRDSVLYFESTDSTNTQAKLLAAQGAAHGTVLIAEHQTGGRGRLGRSFSSPSGMGVYLSVILRPNCPPEHLMRLTCAVAVSMCNVVEQITHIRPGIKWTNDLVYHGKKLAGILTELGWGNHGVVDYAVVGIGVNCCQLPCDFPHDIRAMASSLTMINSQEIDRNHVAAAMIEALWHMELTDNFMEQYRANCITLGQDVSLLSADGSVRHAHAISVDEQGALIVRFPDGSVETVSSGEVSVRGMYGYI